MKVLIIGLGSIALKHIDAIKKINSKSKIYALRSIKNSRNIHDIKNLYNISEVPGDIDFILISNPTSLHAETILNVISLKKPLFIEKPVFDTLVNNEKILGLINSNNIYTYVGCNLRFHPALAYLKNYLNNSFPKINEVNIYCGSYLPSWRPNEDYRNSYSSKKKLGGGVHLDLIHELDYSIWLFGFPLKRSLHLRKVSNLEIDSCDYCHYVLEYEKFNIMITLNYYRKLPKRIIEIVIDDDIITCDLLNSTVYKNESKVLFKQEDFHIFETYVTQMGYFINNLYNNNKSMNDINESFQILKFAIDV